MNYNQRGDVNRQKFLKNNQIIFAALLAGQVMFAFAVLINTPGKGIILSANNDPLFYITPLLAISGWFMGFFLFRKQVAKANERSVLKEKLALYQGGIIQRFALLEGPCLLAIVSYKLSGNLFYLIIAATNIVIFINLLPRKEKISNELNLSYEDKTELGW